MNAAAIDADAQSIVALNVWRKAGVYNWALLPQTSAEPIVVHVESKPQGAIAGRLLFFPGFAAYRDFALLLQAPDMGLALSQIDVTHWELVGMNDGRHEFQTFRTGYAPRLANDADRAFLAPLVHECLGLMIRFDEEPELPVKFADDKALFARQEGLDGKWHDAPCPMPKDPPLAREERIALGRKECAAAAQLTFAEGEAWEVDFFGVPACRTEEPEPRIMYLFAAVDAQTGRRRAWDRMSVTGNAPDGLKPLWEGLAQRLLAAILRHGRIPGAVNIRSERMARFLRPLGLQIPFRLVQHAKLPALDAELEASIQNRTII